MKDVTTVRVVKADRSKRMKIPLLVVLVLAIVSESGCSDVKNVRCRGTYRVQTTKNNLTQTNEMSDKAILGFDIWRANWFENAISRRNWKGSINLNYNTDPNSDSSTSGYGLLQIGYENGSLINADNAKNEKAEPSQVLYYDKSNGWVRYEDKQGGSSEVFSGICEQEINQ